MNNYFNKEYYVQHYNCNGYTPEQWESFGERHPFIGIWMITYGTINLVGSRYISCWLLVLPIPSVCVLLWTLVQFEYHWFPRIINHRLNYWNTKYAAWIRVLENVNPGCLNPNHAKFITCRMQTWYIISYIIGNE